MAQLGNKFIEIGRGYKNISIEYKCPYITGVDINNIEKPYMVAMGDNHADSAALLISTDELISGRWDEHIHLSNCVEFVENLKIAIKKGESFPQNCVLEFI